MKRPAKVGLLDFEFLGFIFWERNRCTIFFAQAALRRRMRKTEDRVSLFFPVFSRGQPQLMEQETKEPEQVGFQKLTCWRLSFLIETVFLHSTQAAPKRRMRKTEDWVWQGNLFRPFLPTARVSGEEATRWGGVPLAADLLALKLSYRDRVPSLHSGSSEETHSQDRGLGMTRQSFPVFLANSPGIRRGSNQMRWGPL